MRNKKPEPLRPPELPHSPTPVASFFFPSTVEPETTLEDLRISAEKMPAFQAESLTLRLANLKKCDFSGAILKKPHLTDVTLDTADLANAEFTRTEGSRILFKSCRLTGFAAPDSEWSDITVADCHAKYARFPDSTFKYAVFERCDLSEADFFHCDLTGVVFRDCDLRGARFADSNCRNLDLRGSLVEGLIVGNRELQGAIIEPAQASVLITHFGVTVRWPGQE